MVHSNLRNKTTFNPKLKDNKHIKVFKHMVTEEVKNLTVKKIEEPRSIKIGIQKLTKRKDLVIRPSDKGGGIVIQTTEQYHKGMLKLLEDPNTYCILPSNPIFKWRTKLEQVAHLGLKKKILDKKEARYLIPEACRTPIIYALPKIHKDKTDPL